MEKLADRVTIIREGVTVEADTIAQLRHLTRWSASSGPSPTERATTWSAARPG
ncbi:MAG: hypothetical protein WCF12_07545 [Propionicimonas sp.]